MLVGLLVHDRPALLRACLESLRRDPGTDYTLVMYGDKAAEECREIAKVVPDAIWLDCPEHYGIAHGLNQILRLRRAGEDFCWVGSDTTLDSPGWLRCLEESGFDVAASSYACGFWFYSGEVVDTLGGFRVHGGTYGGVDRDYFLRAQAAGFRYGEVPEVRCTTPPEQNLTVASRREAMEKAVKELSRLEPVYAAGERLYEPLGAS